MTPQDVAKGRVPTTVNEAAAQAMDRLPKVVARYVIDARTMNNLWQLAEIQSAHKRQGCAACGEALRQLLQHVECQLDIEP
jgi:RNase P subunit RPR2